MRSTFALACTLALIVPALAAAEPTNGKELMELMREKNDSKTQVSEISMELIDKKGRTQDRKLMVFAEQVGDSENSLTRFVEPRRVRGIGFLVTNNEGDEPARYLYTPVDKKTRRVPKGDDKKSFQGTDFTYYDLSPHDIDSDDYQPLVDDEVDGHAVWICTSIPGDDSPLYSKVVQYVRKDVLVPVKIEFYDLDGELWKISTADELKEIDGYWTPMVSTMHNVQIDHRTVMRVERVTFDRELPEHLFTRTALENAD